MSTNNNTHNMANTPASNGQLTLATGKKKITRRKRKADPCALTNQEKSIWNPLTGRYIGHQHYYRLKSKFKIDLSQLDRNNWITTFHGRMEDDDFLNQPHVQDYLHRNTETPEGQLARDDGRTIHDPDFRKNIGLDAFETAEILKEMKKEQCKDVTNHTAPATTSIHLTSDEESPEYESLMRTCINQAKMIDRLQAEVQQLELARKKDDELLERFYKAGRESYSMIERAVDEVGCAIGISSDDRLPF